jgi:hypothetical protein
MDFRKKVANRTELAKDCEQFYGIIFQTSHTVEADNNPSLIGLTLHPASVPLPHSFA